MGKESVCNAGDTGSIPGLGRSPGGWHDNPLRYSCLESPMDRGAWQIMGHKSRKESDTTEASEHACMHTTGIEKAQEQPCWS